ncbi:MAG TPA: PilZ domain-containing protein [Candidatus Acidoferrales bacterium]|nr:PilZ domain-containing protein [Candidatus Acidoferrales bacterium]
MSGAERRRHKRYPCKATVKITWGQVALEATLRDISASGMYLETHEPLWVRAQFSARVMLPEPIRVECIVRRVDAGKGMVVEFTDITQETKMNLTHLLWKLAHQ